MDFKERGYFEDPYRTEFSAQVKEVNRDKDGSFSVYLDRTFFYPVSGGQPDDGGTMGGKLVLEVSEDDRGVRHRLDGEVRSGETVKCRIDWKRRFDHMQQHTGQHLLSCVFLEFCNAPTIGFHLGERECTIDIKGDIPRPETAQRIESRVNEIVWADVTVRATVLGLKDYDEYLSGRAGSMMEGIRSRLPEGVDRVRIVEIGELDSSTCCGTHCRGTGEIGLVKILGFERVKGNARVRFICGVRALDDYTHKHGLLSRLAGGFSTDWQELERVIDKQADENRALRKSNEELKAELAGSRAVRIMDEAETIGRFRLIRRIFEEAYAGSVRGTALKVREEDGAIVLFGVRMPKPALIFACNPGVSLDMGEILKASAEVMGARGGGGRDLAQGGGGVVERLEDALEEAERRVRELLE